MSFREDLAAARSGPALTADVTVTINESQHVIRITKMPSVDYAEETLRHPPRLDIGVDREFGYNLTTLTRAVMSRCAQLLEGGELVSLEPEEWADLFTAANGRGVQELQNTVFTLNEFSSAKAVDAARKVVDAFAGISPLP